MRDPLLYWDVSPGGTCAVDPKVHDEWASTPSKGHTYLIEKLPTADVAKVLDDLISMPPALNKEK